VDFVSSESSCGGNVIIGGRKGSHKVEVSKEEEEKMRS